MIGKPLVLGKVTEDKQFGTDPYIVKNQVKSILCMPIKKQDEVQGLLYLENQHAAFAFPQSRVNVVTILTSQMAISLGNLKLQGKEVTMLN